MVQQGHKKSASDHCVFVQNFSDNDFVIVLLYVDDMLIVGYNSSRIVSLKKELSNCFAMKDMGPAKNIMGMRIIHNRKCKTLWLSQEKYLLRSTEVI